MGLINNFKEWTQRFLSRFKRQKTFPVILEYCGGEKTDRLYEKLSKDNPNYKINVLDNCSPKNKSKYITHQNEKNSFVGGGIKDCINLAKKNKCKYLFFFANDIKIINKIDIKYFEKLMKKDKDIVQAGASLTKDSDKTYYPWIINKGKNEDRIVRHSDLLACIFRISFLNEIDFPNSKSGWGYDWEIAYHAKLTNKKILISDKFLYRHLEKKDKSALTGLSISKKMDELMKVYNKKYGDYKKIHPIFLKIYKED
jgi:hypothetical protein